MTATLAVKRDREFSDLFAAAERAGRAAGDLAVPVPMIVGSPSTPLGNDIDPTKKTWYVADGVCGFAWINVKPANSAFGNWLKRSGKRNVHSNSYDGGVDISVWDYDQSLTRKEAYARAFAAVLSAAGIKARSRSRMD